VENGWSGTRGKVVTKAKLVVIKGGSHAEKSGSGCSLMAALTGFGDGCEEEKKVQLLV
jgi:hypothetical protein